MSKVAGKSKDRRLMCPKCGWSNIRPSLRHGIIDGLLSIARLAPFRCRNCRHRFYRFSRRKNGFTPVESTSPQPARPLSILVEPAPISKPMAVAQSPSGQMTPYPEKPRSILVVDSDVSIRRLLCRVSRTRRLSHPRTPSDQRSPAGIACDPFRSSDNRSGYAPAARTGND